MVQPATLGHPAGQRSTRTFRHPCPGWTTSSSVSRFDHPSSPSSRTPLQDWDGLPEDALESTLSQCSLHPDLSLAILSSMLYFSSLVHSPIGPNPGDSL